MTLEPQRLRNGLKDGSGAGDGRGRRGAGRDPFGDAADAEDEDAARSDGAAVPAGVRAEGTGVPDGASTAWVPIAVDSRGGGASCSSVPVLDAAASFDDTAGAAPPPDHKTLTARRTSTTAASAPTAAKIRPDLPRADAAAGAATP